MLKYFKINVVDNTSIKKIQEVSEISEKLQKKL